MTTSSQHAQNIFLESLEVLLKSFEFDTTLLENILLNSVSVIEAQNQPAKGLGPPQNPTIP